MDFGHVGFRGNEAAGRAAKEALYKKPTQDLMPFSDLKPSTAKYIHQVWQKEWNQTVLVSNKFHEILLYLSDTQSLTAKYIHLVWQKEWDEALLKYPTSFMTSYQNFRTNC